MTHDNEGVSSPLSISYSPPNWLRLQKALSVEADRGFNDLQGKEHRFSEFLSLSLNQPPESLPADAQRRWQALSSQFITYSEMSFAQRQHLVADTRRFLHQARQTWEQSTEKIDGLGNAGTTRQTKLRTPNSAPQAQSSKAQSAADANKIFPAETLREQNSSPLLTLDQPLTYLAGVGAKNAEKLAKLGLLTVRDVLYYYPRDHIDYARQVNIRELKEGETVTLVAFVKRCTCFSSPRNPKLTILELMVRDHTGQLKLSRFYAGSRYGNRGWQEQQKRQYPPGAAIAVSGLVKRGKYGVTIEDPEIEVLDHSGGEIDSLKVGRLVPIYPLTDGVGADLVRRTVVAVLPATLQLQEALPDYLRSQYNLVSIHEAIAHIHFPPKLPPHDPPLNRMVFNKF
ncbi:MAG: hypothetical protein LH647_02000 [Leptolyngbyaceae cyanobacterium CAN_BIN12]|nr:hypothetical protein [Leptolyngbyaceae cyanobacterium CAN_BIN12]